MRKDKENKMFNDVTQKNELGNYLKELRGKKSIREVSKEMGLSHTYLSTLEKGQDPRTGNRRKPSFDALSKISSYYGISYTNLISKMGFGKFSIGELGNIEQYASKVSYLMDNIRKTAPDNIDLNDIITNGTTGRSNFIYDVYRLNEEQKYLILNILESLLVNLFEKDIAFTDDDLKEVDDMITAYLEKKDDNAFTINNPKLDDVKATIELGKDGEN